MYKGVLTYVLGYGTIILIIAEIEISLLPQRPESRHTDFDSHT